MNIIIVDGFKMISENDGEILLLESNRLQEYLDYAKKRNLKKISLQGYHGFNIVQTDFFENYNFFTFVSIHSYLKEINISGIKYLHNLECLRVNNKNQPINLGDFPVLEYASLDWNKKLVNLDTSRKLSTLELRKFNPESKSLHELCRLRGLRSLGMIQSNILSIDGIENLDNLIEYEAYYLSKLDNVDKLATIAKSLISLTLSHCKKIIDYSFLKKLTRLTKLRLLECGSLSSLDFVSVMPDLEFLSFVGTNIENGDLSILTKRKIKFVSFDDKRHYSHKMKEITPDFSWKAK